MESTTVNFAADCRDDVNYRDFHHFTLKTGEDDSSTAYTSSICDSRTSKSSRSISRSATRSRSRVHNRLFERSIKKNEEGKKLRQMIEKSRNPTPPPIVKISETEAENLYQSCLLYTSPSPRDRQKSRMPSSA